MSDIIKAIKGLKNMRCMGGASQIEIDNAEIRLGFRLSEEYEEYLAEFGVVSAYSTELTGISKEKYLDVVAVTEKLRKYNDVPKDYYVVEDTSVDGIVIWQNTKGEIYETSPNSEPKKIADSLAEYLQEKMR